MAKLSPRVSFLEDHLDCVVALDPPHEQTAHPLDIATCQLELDGHDWTDRTTVTDSRRRYVCRVCSAKGHDEARTPELVGYEVSQIVSARRGLT